MRRIRADLRPQVHKHARSTKHVTGRQDARGRSGGQEDTMRLRRMMAALFVILTGVAAAAHAQTTSAELRGTVVDPQSSVVAGAKVTLEHEATADVRETRTNDAGLFVFPSIVPGSYRLKVEADGFKTLDRTSIVLSANERRSLGSLTVEVGGVSETVSIAANAVSVRTSSSENSAMISSQQLDTLASRGRDVVSLLRVLPGVSTAGDSQSLGGTFGTATPNISGTRNNMNTVTLDGQTGSDVDLQGTFNGATSLDAVAEVTVLRNNYQAEYGRNAGAVVNIISKSGTRDFRGSAYWFVRNEALNANDFFNNRNGLAKPLYRYNTLGGTLGGPIYIPGKFNADRSKLFFFYSREDWRIDQPSAVSRVTVPTALERQGNFSQTVDNAGRLIVIRDPATGQAFPGNVIPSGRINSLGTAMLNLFPMPTITDRALTGGNYNYEFQEVQNQPKKQNLLKIDYQPNATDRFSVRGRTWWADQRGYGVTAGFNSNWDQFAHHYLFTENSISGSYTKVLTSTMVNELVATFRSLGEQGQPASSTTFNPVTRGQVGLGGLGQFVPQQNPYNIIPIMTFGGVPNAATISYNNRLPIDAGDTRVTVLNNFSWVRGPHGLKFGVYVERNKGSEGPRSNFGGNFSFARDVNNPSDANWAYANALLGNFTSYTESTARIEARNAQTLAEWFAQDSWRATRKLTLELGLRFSWASPVSFPDGDTGAFVLDRYNAARAPQLYRPVRNAQGQRVGQDPITGALVPAVLIGAYVPGSGDPLNGTAAATDPAFVDGFVSSGGINLGPRAGFAYDVFGDSKTAIRGSFGVTRNMAPGNGTWAGAGSTNPPTQFNPQVFYGNVNTYLNTSGVLFPSNVAGWNYDYKIPTLYSWSLGVQRDIGHGMSAEVTYVGNRGRDLVQSRNINTLPYGARFLPSSQDPSSPGVPLADNFLRPYPGYGNITMYEWTGKSQYTALQTALNRRYRNGLAFGVAYTLSRSLDYTSGDYFQSGLPLYRPLEEWSWGRSAFDQTHVMNINYTWDVPHLSKLLPNPVISAIFDRWQIAGITTFASGTPLGFSFTTSNNVDLTGGGDGQRVVLTGPAELSRGDRSFTRWFNTGSVALPARGEFGNAPKDVVSGPGVHNWDVSLFKNIPLGAAAKGRILQFRWEMYNVFNHTQFNGVDTSAVFDAQGNQIDTLFGTITSTRTPRVMQGALRFQF
jgi:hypothetical protein